MAKIGINISTGSLQQSEIIVGIDLGAKRFGFRPKLIVAEGLTIRFEGVDPFDETKSLLHRAAFVDPEELVENFAHVCGAFMDDDGRAMVATW